MTKPDSLGVILLAAGFGRRLLPFTAHTPKPLTIVGGRTLLDRVIANCRREGVGKFAINIHHLADKLEAYIDALPQSFIGAEFAVSDERSALLDTGGGAKKAMALLTADPLLICNTDAFWPEGADTPIARMRDQFARSGGIVLLCADPARSTGFRRSHDFCLAPDGHIRADRGAPVIYTGVALMLRSALEASGEGTFSLADSFFTALETGDLWGVRLNAPWLHVGDPEALLEAEQVLRETVKEAKNI